MRIWTRVAVASVAIAAIVAGASASAVATAGGTPGASAAGDDKSRSRLSPDHVAANQLLVHVANYNSGQCLAVPGGNTAPGTGLIQWPCGTWRDHYWDLVYAGNGLYQIVNYNSGQCLAVPGASTTPGTQVIQWPCASA